MTLPHIQTELDPHLAVQTVLAYDASTTVEENTHQMDPGSVEAYVRSYFKDIPLLADIAWCESRFVQFDPNTHQVFRGAMNPADVGVMQINEYYHSDTAEAFGYDLHTLDGNLAYARNLYEREGVRPWAASAACWQPKMLAYR